MRIFISWSGDLARDVASELREWLPDVIQSVDCWVSKHDIAKGQSWNRQIADVLNDSAFGLVVVTRDNQAKPWLLFEAGALSRRFHEELEARVAPLLVDLRTGELEDGSPLKQFQATTYDRLDLLELVLSINAIATSPVEEKRIRHAFEREWERLEKALDALLKKHGSTPTDTVEDLEAIKAELEELREERERFKRQARSAAAKRRLASNSDVAVGSGLVVRSPAPTFDLSRISEQLANTTLSSESSRASYDALRELLSRPPTVVNTSDQTDQEEADDESAT